MVFIAWIIIAFSLENAVFGESWLMPLVNMWKLILNNIFGITIFVGIINVIGLNIYWRWKNYKQRIQNELKEEIKNMKAIVREFKNHDVITYKVDELRFIRLVNYALNLDCYPEKYSTLIEFVAPNGREAINTSDTIYFVYSGETALFKKYKNELSSFYEDTFEFIKKHNINLTDEDIKAFGEFLKINVYAESVEEKN